MVNPLLMPSSKPDPTAKVYQQIDTRLQTVLLPYLVGSIGIFKTYNFKYDAYDMSAHFKIRISNTPIKISTDTFTIVSSVIASLNDEELSTFVADKFMDMIPYAAVKVAYEYWHTTYTGRMTLWGFLRMTEKEFDNMMLNNVIPPAWNPNMLNDLTSGTITNSDGSITISADGIAYNVGNIGDVNIA